MVKIFNSLTRKLEVFQSITPGQVGLYNCGPTVYQSAHIGNLRSYVFEDILRRVLEFNDYTVKEVLNITDVGHLTSDADTGEDKLEQEAKKRGKSAWEISSLYTQAFVEDLRNLNIKLPVVMPKATDHIPEQIELVKLLEKRGFTYKTSDGVYFDTGKLSDYGKLAPLNLVGQRSGARVEENTEKKSSHDFALWKNSVGPLKRQMEWESPWGIGFPGWHLECSAMSVKYLGQPFDIHTGGIDHIPTHHTNEIAQSEAAYGKPLANYFVHGEFLVWDKDQKMGKSQGNIVTLAELTESGYDPISLRYLVLTAHYRSKLNFSLEALAASQTALQNLRRQVSSFPTPGQVNTTFERKFNDLVSNDLDTPGALALTWELMKKDMPGDIKAATLFRLDEVLGLGLAGAVSNIDKTAQKLINDREEARERKEFGRADLLRTQLEEMGYALQDTKSGPRWFKKGG